MRGVLPRVLGIVLVLAGLFACLPPFLGIPCLGWYRDLVGLFKASAPAAAVLVGLVLLASAR